MGLIVDRIRHLFRYFQLFIAVKKLRSSDNDLNKELARKKIADILAKKGGLAMKIGQVVADVGQEKAFENLLKGVEQRTFKELHQQFESLPAHPALKDFSFIDEHAVAASIGQVHRGRLVTGEDVAIKIQYPDIQQTIKAELGLAGMMPKAGPVKQWEIDLDGYRSILKEDLLEELDYHKEAQSQFFFKQRLNIEGLIIPEVYLGYCSSSVLVQSWEEGVYFDEILDWPKRDKLLIARILLVTLLKSLFELGSVHGDPHMGNCFYRRNKQDRPEVVLLDFGCTIKISKIQRLSLLKLIMMLREGESVSAIDYFVAMGFSADKLSKIENEMNAIGRVLLKPFLTDEPFAIEDWNIGSTIEVMLQEKKWWFRSAGPPELFLLIRAFQGVMNQVSRLGVQLPWWVLLCKEIGKETLEEAYSLVVPKVKTTNIAPVVQSIAESLKVQITKGEEIIMSMTLPPDAALDMKSIMPEAALALLDGDDWDTENLKQKLVQSKLAPQVIYSKKKGEKLYKIWLE